MQHPSCRRLFEWWQSFSPGQPRRGDFDIVDHAELAANIYLSELLEDGRFEVRLQGEEIARIFAPDGFPRFFGVHDPDPYGQVARNYVEAIARNAPLLHSGTLRPFDKDFIAFESLDIPLGTTDRHKGHILGVLFRL